MELVTEHYDAFPFDTGPRAMERHEELLLADPLPSRKALREHAPIEVVHFPGSFDPVEFAHPRPVYESPMLRVEWQTMPEGARQPFYHRNNDAYELSYQVDGERTLITDLGTLQLTAGDFTLLPATVAHDNRGWDDIHVLFYTPEPITELTDGVGESELRIPPFPGWEPGPLVNELITEGLAGPDQDLVMTPVDEVALLEQAKREDARLHVLRPPAGSEGTTWLYRSPRIMIGKTTLSRSDGRVYLRHRDVDEIQYQVSGQRLLVTQRGVARLEPGDFVQVPAGVAFTTIATEPTAYLRLCTRDQVPRIADVARRGQQLTGDQLAAARHGVLGEL
jgi:uncharacterized cupin superfamily protein